MKTISFIKIFSLATLMLFASCGDENEEEPNEVSCELSFESTLIINDSTNEADYIFEASGLESKNDITYSWTIDGENTDETSNVLNYVFIENGTYTVCILTETPECPSGVESCQEIIVDSLPESTDECPEISFEALIQNDGYSFQASNQPDSVTANYVWSIDNEYIEGNFFDGSNNEYFAHNFTENGTYNVCVFIETPECPNGIEYCEDVIIDTIDECPEVTFEYVLQNSIYTFMASTSTEFDSRYSWSVNGEFIDNNAVEIEDSKNFTYDFPENGIYNICVSIETPECPQGITYCNDVNIQSVDDGTIIDFNVTVSNGVQDKSAEACSDLTYSYTQKDNNIFTLDVDNAEEVGAVSWLIDGDYIGSGTTIDYEFGDNSTYTICAIQETPDCPGNVSFCREFLVEIATNN